MQSRQWLWRSVVLILMSGMVGCGGPKEPEDMIKISIASTGEPAQRDVLLVPDLDGATVDVWEFKEAPDLSSSSRKKKDAKPPPPTRSSRITKADWVALWKAFPKGHIWNLTDAKPSTGVGSLPIYTVELKNNGRHVKAIIEGPDQCADKSGWQIIEPVLKIAGIK